MNILSVHEASREIGDRLLYDRISFGMDDTDKIALIGINGSGKSTLMRTIAGIEHFDSGNITRNNELRIGCLEQTVRFSVDQTVEEFILSSENRRVRVFRDFHAGIGNHDALEKQMNELDAWKLESEMREILHHLNVPVRGSKMSELSGGMARKVALARLLIEDNNLLLLDEPTNHLDIDSIAWLEEELIRMKRALLIITHDRYFLDNVADHILELDGGHISKYRGNYSTFLERKAEIAAIEQATLQRHKNILRTELEWLSRMPKARGTKQKARIQSIGERQQAVKTLQPGKSMGKLFSGEEKTGRRILEAVNISKKFGDKVVIPAFEYEFTSRSRIALIGHNGAGKTTFLNVISGRLPSDTGKVVQGVNTRIGFLSQVSEPLAENATPLQVLKDIANYFEDDAGRKITAGDLLDRFLFSGAQQHQKVNRLSGGERRRLDILRLLMRNPNFLILDEPTNDLDLQTLALLEEYLMDFAGSVLIASHDRYFLDKLADTLFIFEAGQAIQIRFEMCSDYLFQQSQERKRRDSAGKAEKAAAKVAEKKPRKLSYKHQMRKEELEKEIPRTEAEISALEAKLASGETDVAKITEWSSRYAELESSLFNLLEELQQIETTVE